MKKFQDVKFQDVKFTVPKCKHEIFVRIHIKHPYFSNYFIICVAEIIIELFVVYQKLMFMQIIFV